MRTAVVRVNVDPAGVLTSERLREGMDALRGFIAGIGADLVDDEIEARPAGRRELELLIACDDVEAAKQTAIDLCAKVFDSAPVAGVVTFISRGTDDDAHGVLSAFGLAGEITRRLGDDGFDIVYVTLREADLERVPESRIHTALEASLNCEVHIRTR
ncbi:MAG: hypothetical protein K2X56_26440 [Mycobacterium pseudokansasii]|uniref:Uncharacterized protein n=1 Tax=Mycobacterium pseudokansasii TaxID=2341080 RepID=A0A498R0S6_9MYCO|nr:hypothetical protein [Mycobacterium pseudokansasii]KZS68352.1 hypothetical protein A4G27_09330 [Mycobacterium kansasii]MBY0391525.1 hypothetical protein [Mycobacterium pseudokansasii]VBA30907.1 hypothetical protein LAUMK35_04887 [Mycobacterium pseudokansasii]VBA32830.1 hypothetical protein LAUMK21_04877 [Mycobacterium pseudokansasii]VBA54771.1 hypothetical protein LAUMK142_04791 [Mycobacterium pseudokansasii]